MKRMVMCKSQDLRGAMGMAKQLCGDGKMGGSGSGGGKKDGDDFCSNAPNAKMMKECKEAHMECMKSSSDAAKQKKCWYDKKKQLEEKAKRAVDFCDHAQDDDTKKKCKEEQRKCMAFKDPKKQKECWADKVNCMSMKNNGACFAAIKKKYGDGKMGGSGSGGGKMDGDVCDMALKMMKDMMKGVTDVKKVSNDKKMALCKSYMAMDKGMMKRMMMCKSQDLKDAMGMAKQLCGDGKMGGSGSGAAKKITTAKPASTLCAGALKTLGGFKDITDVKNVNMLKKAVLCKAFKDIDKVKLASIKFACKSEDVKRSLKTADALCGAKKTTTAKAGSGSGGAKKTTTAKPASTLCAGVLKTLGGFKDITDVKNVNTLKKAVLCKAYKDIPKVKLATIKFSCKSEDVKRLLKTADALCGAKKITTTKAGSGSGGAKRLLRQ